MKKFIIAPLICTSLALFSCSPAPPPVNNSKSDLSTPTPSGPITRSTGDQIVNGKTINSEMSDAQILEAFDMDIKTAKQKRSNGSDGFTTAYTAGEQTVYITHSVVTGTNVMASGPIKAEVWLSEAVS